MRCCHVKYCHDYLSAHLWSVFNSWYSFHDSSLVMIQCGICFYMAACCMQGAACVGQKLCDAHAFPGSAPTPSSCCLVGQERQSEVSLCLFVCIGYICLWTWLVWSEQQFIMCLWVCLHAVNSCICVCIECVSVKMVSVVKGVFAFSVGSGVMCVMWFCQGSRWMCVCVVGATSVAHSVSSGWSSGQRAEPRF